MMAFDAEKAIHRALASTTQQNHWSQRVRNAFRDEATVRVVKLDGYTQDRFHLLQAEKIRAWPLRAKIFSEVASAARCVAATAARGCEGVGTHADGAAWQSVETGPDQPDTTNGTDAVRPRIQQVKRVTIFLPSLQ